MEDMVYLPALQCVAQQAQGDVVLPKVVYEVVTSKKKGALLFLPFSS